MMERKSTVNTLSKYLARQLHPTKRTTVKKKDRSLEQQIAARREQEGAEDGA